jgi:hypothetical protein
MSTDYDIKVDGEPASFEGGAIRYKKNKGRFDLIPTDVESRVLNKLRNIVNTDSEFGYGYYEILNYLTKVNDTTNDDRFIDIILAITFDHYACKCLAAGDTNEENNLIYLDNLYDRYVAMLRDLAIHFQKGADKYGEHNCEKGIELWSFIDSGTRHTLQYLSGEQDEPHFISSIWNFWMADWTLHHNK